MKNLKKFIRQSPLQSLLLLGFVLRIIAAFYANGFYAHDDYYCLVDVAWGWTNGEDPGNWFVSDFLENTQLRSVIYPGTVYLELLFAKFLGVSDPYYQMIIVQLFHGLYSLLIILFSYRITEAISNKKSAFLVGLMSASLWFFPFLSVRTMSEWTSIPIVLWAFDIYFVSKNRTIKQYIFIGVLLAIAFAVRYQTAFITLGFGIAILVKDKWKPFMIMSSAFVLVTVLVQGVGDYFVCAMPFGKLIEYVQYNLKHSGSYVSRPIWDYILLIPALLLPPIGSMAFYYVFRKGWKHLPLFLPIVLFLLFHSVFENKQERFIFTILPLILILGTPYVLEQMNKKWWSQTKKIIFISIYGVINTYLLCLMTVNYTKKSKVELMRYLRAKEDVKEVYILNTSKGSAGQNINLVPEFYFGGRLVQHKIESLKDFNSINRDSVTLNSYVLFEIHPDKEALSQSRIDEAEKAFGALEFQKRIEGSLIDNFRYRLNSVLHNDEYVIYKKVE